jgi:hypothetical protein
VTAAVGSGALLRTAALPIGSWLSGGSPDLFARLRALDEQTAAYRDAARDAAEAIGERLVPHPAVDGHGRVRALRIRRLLHNGSVPPFRDGVALADLAGRVLPGDDLAGRLTDLLTLAGALPAARRDVDRLTAAEEDRVLAAPWRLLHGSPAGRAAVRAGDLAVYDDIAARVAAGEPWTGKRMRRRSDYLWRMLTQAATRATPRGWLAHVALLPVVEVGGWAGTGPLRVGACAATDEAANLDRRRAAHGTAEQLLADPTVEVAVAPLSRLDPEYLVVWTPDGEDRDRLGEARLRRTPALDAIVSALSGGALPASRLLHILAGPEPARRAALAGLLAHLVRLSALQVSIPARYRLSGWEPIGAAGSRVEVVEHDDCVEVVEHDDYVDVYRPAAAGLATAYAHRLAALAGPVLRLAALADLDADADADAPAPPALGSQPRGLLDAAADCLRTGVEVGRGRPHHHDWPAVTSPGSGYAALVRLLGHRMDAGEPLDIADAVLDGLGAPEPVLDWPVDCLLRPLRAPAGVLAVLDQVAPAGVLDARFTPALGALHGAVPQLDAYREFLAGLTGVAGIPLVEVLVPPLSERAANPVRRPCCTPLWTGDPDRAGHLGPGAAGYVPLSRITLRVEDGRVVAEADGRPIWPVRHTARVAAPPWDAIVDLLMLASPQPECHRYRTLGYSLPAWPDREAVPRITVGGALVVTPAQWRVDRSELWDPADRLGNRLAALERLRRRRRLPRLVSVAAEVHDEPVAVDLCSLPGLRVLDRHAQRGAASLLVRELFADPDQVPVADGADDAGPPAGHVAELLLRLPVDASAEALGRRAARRAHRPHGPKAGSPADHHPGGFALSGRR